MCVRVVSEQLLFGCVSLIFRLPNSTAQTPRLAPPCRKLHRPLARLCLATSPGCRLAVYVRVCLAIGLAIWIITV